MDILSFNINGRFVVSLLIVVFVVLSLTMSADAMILHKGGDVNYIDSVVGAFCSLMFATWLAFALKRLW